MIEFGSFRYDRASGFLYRGDEEIPLPPLYSFKGMYPQANQLCDQERWADCAWIYVVSGEHNKAREMLPGLQSPVTIAIVHGALGEVDEALRYLDRAYWDRQPAFVVIGVSPQMEGLRSDSGFLLRVETLASEASTAATPGGDSQLGAIEETITFGFVDGEFVEVERDATGEPGTDLRAPLPAGVLVATVRNSAGAALPGVQVTVAGPAIIDHQSGVTDRLGTVRFSLPAGIYRVTLRRTGFSTLVREDVDVSPDRTTTLTAGLRTSRR